MAEEPPTADERTSADLLAHLRTIAPFYTDAWDPAGDGSGTALAETFADVAGDVVERLNQVPEKHRVAFFDSVGFTALPPTPARVPLAFDVADGQPENVPIPAGTQAVAPAADDRPEQTFTVGPEDAFEGTPASLARVVSVDPETDRVVPHWDPETGLTESTLFAGANAQEHVLYLGHDDICQLSEGGRITVDLTTTTDEETFLDDLVWEYWGEKPNEDGDPVTDWHELTLAVTSGDIADPKSPAGKPYFEQWMANAGEELASLSASVKEDLYAKVAAKVLETGGAILDGGFTPPYTHTYEVAKTFMAEPTVTTNVVNRAAESFFLTVSTTGTSPTDVVTAADADVSLPLALPAGGKTLERAVDGVTSRWIRCRFLRREDYREAPWLDDPAEPPPDRLFDVAVEDVELASGPDALAPDMLLSNDVPLSLEADDGTPEVRPFGDVPRLLDTFYLASAEAFTKPDTEVTVTFGDPAPETEGDVDKPSVSLPDQRTDGSYVLVESVTLPEGGFVTVRETGSMAPEWGYPAGASSYLEPGTHDCVEVPLTLVPTTQSSPRTESLKAYAVRDTTGDRQFTPAMFAGGDARYTHAGAEVSDSATLTVDRFAGSGPTLSWEYWNGDGWTRLPDFEDRTCDLRVDGTVSFVVPRDLAPTGVAGHDHHWIRVRLVDGDYGRPSYEEADGSWTQDTTSVDPPQFDALSLSYGTAEPPDHLIPYNSLEYGTDLGRSTFERLTPFQRPQAPAQTVYFGFDGPLDDGPIHVFVDPRDVEYETGFYPRVRWAFCTDPDSMAWTRPTVRDGSESLTRQGVVALVFPEATVPCARFGHELHWLRARVSGTEFVYGSAAAATGSDQASLAADGAGKLATEMGEETEGSEGDPDDDDTGDSDDGTCSDETTDCEPDPCGTTLSTAPATGAPGRPPPDLFGIYPNATWAANLRTVDDEILGSSDGRQEQSFTVSTPPVVDESVWVDELATLSEGARASLTAQSPDRVEAVTTDGGDLRAFWVRWERVDSLYESGPDDRHYTLDPTLGEVTFGDGRDGAIPSRGSDNVRIDYTTGGGAAGNVPESAVSDLKSSVAFVDGVTNPIAADGGAAAETTQAVLHRAPQEIRDRNRAMAPPDYERIALSTSRKLARAKCIPAMDDGGRYRPGWVTVLVVPNVDRRKPAPSVELKRQVTETLRAHAPASLVRGDLSKLVVRGPSFVEATVQTTVAPETVGSVAAVEAAVKAALRVFLHPLSGGPDGDGWAFGHLPCRSDLFARLEAVEGIDHVVDLRVTFNGQGDEVTVTEGDEVPTVADDALVFSGDHDVDATGGV